MIGKNDISDEINENGKISLLLYHRPVMMVSKMIPDLLSAPDSKVIYLIPAGKEYASNRELVKYEITTKINEGAIDFINRFIICSPEKLLKNMDLLGMEARENRKLFLLVFNFNLWFTKKHQLSLLALKDLIITFNSLVNNTFRFSPNFSPLLIIFSYISSKGFISNWFHYNYSVVLPTFQIMEKDLDYEYDLQSEMYIPPIINSCENKRSLIKNFKHLISIGQGSIILLFFKEERETVKWQKILKKLNLGPQNLEGITTTLRINDRDKIWDQLTSNQLFYCVLPSPILLKNLFASIGRKYRITAFFIYDFEDYFGADLLTENYFTTPVDFFTLQGKNKRKIYLWGRKIVYIFLSELWIRLKRLYYEYF